MKKINLLKLVLSIIVILALVILGVIVYKMTSEKEIEQEELYVAKIEVETEDYTNRFDMTNKENAEINGDIKTNTSSKIAEEKIYSNLKINNVKLESNVGTGITSFTANVENISEQDYSGRNVDLELVDNHGEKITTISVYIDDVPSGQSTQLSFYTATDIANAYDFVIKNY